MEEYKNYCSFSSPVKTNSVNIFWISLYRVYMHIYLIIYNFYKMLYTCIQSFIVFFKNLVFDQKHLPVTWDIPQKYDF